MTGRVDPNATNRRAANRKWEPSRRDEDYEPPEDRRRTVPVKPRPKVKQTVVTKTSAAGPRPARFQPRQFALSMQRVDYPLIAVLATLLGLGLVMVYSASMQRALTFMGQPAYFFIRQVIWVVAGGAVLLVMTSIPYKFWQRIAIPIMAIALLLLVAVLMFGDRLLGAKRTLFHGSLQPSEFVKLAVVIYVAAWVASKKDQLAKVSGGLVPFAILIGIVAGLIALEPSLSVTIIVLVTGTTIFFVGGGNVKQLVIIGLIAVVVLAVVIWQSDYGAHRVESWWNSVLDPTQAHYDVAQAMEIIRRGHGIDTSQSNWMLKATVPLLWSDYLFANVGADLGFPGTLAVVILFAALGYRGLSIALNAPDSFGGLTAIGITTWILTQALIHVGVSLALIPSTGVPLPFMSYGGSATVANMAAMGLLLSISRTCPEKRASYADFSFGWWHRRPRLPHLSARKRADGERKAANDKKGPGSPAPRTGRTHRRISVRR